MIAILDKSLLWEAVVGEEGSLEKLSELWVTQPYEITSATVLRLPHFVVERRRDVQRGLFEFVSTLTIQLLSSLP